MDIQSLVATNLNTVRKPATGPKAEQEYFRRCEFAFPRLRLPPAAVFGAFIGLAVIAGSAGLL
jgi:hypothetical protein